VPTAVLKMFHGHIVNYGAMVIGADLGLCVLGIVVVLRANLKPCKEPVVTAMAMATVATSPAGCMIAMAPGAGTRTQRFL